MNLFQALGYFATEALTNLLRGWRISSLAVATTALSLFIGGTLILLGSNMTRAIEAWRSDAQIVVYLEDDVSTADETALREQLRDAPWVKSVVDVSAEDAAKRFREKFPDLRDVLDDFERSPFPL